VFTYPLEPPACRFRISPERRDGGGSKSAPGERPSEQEADTGEHILCRQCRQIVTNAAERISVQGAHRHTFANPHGVVFEIGCFRAVQGCGYVGPATSEWSWFRGYRWRIALCSKCLVHLGWLYASGGGDSFSGLILDRLIESKEA